MFFNTLKGFTAGVWMYDQRSPMLALFYTSLSSEYIISSFQDTERGRLRQLKPLKDISNYSCRNIKLFGVDFIEFDSACFLIYFSLSLLFAH